MLAMTSSQANNLVAFILVFVIAVFCGWLWYDLRTTKARERQRTDQVSMMLHTMLGQALGMPVQLPMPKPKLPWYWPAVMVWQWVRDGVPHKAPENTFAMVSTAELLKHLPPDPPSQVKTWPPMLAVRVLMHDRKDALVCISCTPDQADLLTTEEGGIEFQQHLHASVPRSILVNEGSADHE